MQLYLEFVKYEKISVEVVVSSHFASKSNLKYPCLLVRYTNVYLSKKISNSTPTVSSNK